TGASTADAAIILVDARQGLLPQTRRHAFIASLLGIPHLAVAINKIDLVDNPAAVCAAVAEDVLPFARSLGFNDVRAFPVSAVRGDHIVTPSTQTPWHKDGTLLAWLEALPHAVTQTKAPLRFPVQLVARPHLDYRGYAGTVQSGTVAVG